MLAGQVLSALRARGQATLDASAANTAGSSPRLLYELEEAVDPVNEGPWERPPLGPGLPPSIHASGVDCWGGLVERLGEPTDVDAVIHFAACPPAATGRPSMRSIASPISPRRSHRSLRTPPTTVASRRTSGPEPNSPRSFARCWTPATRWVTSAGSWGRAGRPSTTYSSGQRRGSDGGSGGPSMVP
jgi:hypothetical protein